ncbi:MAG: nucleotide sugar dehydrogenase [bacterium]
MIAVIGLGFVGLTTALGFSEKGFIVKGFDINKNKRNGINDYKIHFYEPGLKEALSRHLNKKFFITESIDETVNEADIIFYCVGTPENNDGSSNLTYLLQAIEDTFNNIKKDRYKTLVIKSTIPPSTTSEIIKPLLQSKGFIVGETVGLANNPEFLREGYAWSDFINPDRIVIGVEDDLSTEALKSIYNIFGSEIYFVNYNTAEFIKYLSNTLLSTLISFSNEMSVIANTIGNINIPSAFKILHKDARWSGNPAKMASYVYPGCGYGGYCLPKDTKALYQISKKKGFIPKMLKQNIEINKNIKAFLINELIDKISKEQNIGILGLSFKPDSDDVRQSPAFDIINILLNNDYKNIIAYDPLANENFAISYNLPIKYAKNLEELIKKTDLSILITSWGEFKESEILIKSKPIYDLRYYLE